MSQTDFNFSSSLFPSFNRGSPFFPSFFSSVCIISMYLTYILIPMIVSSNNWFQQMELEGGGREVIAFLDQQPLKEE